MIDNFKNWVIETVLWAENALAGKSGKEKRKVVIARLSNALFSIIKLPWYLAWAKGFIATKAIGYLVDLACDKLNLLSGWDFSGVKLSPMQVNGLSTVLEFPASVMTTRAGATFDERLDELYNRYGIAPPDVTPTAAPPSVMKDIKLTDNLAIHEIVCKCGCGFDDVEPALIETFQALRDYIGKPIIITSGCRCEAHNIKVCGAANSGHLTGQALDIYVRGLNKLQLGERIKEAHRAGLLPHLQYCYLIKNTKACVHIGVDMKQRNSIWGW